MGCDTKGKIKGYVSAEEILNFIRQKYDPNVKSYVTRNQTAPIDEVTWKYKFNEHSKDKDYWYTEDGFITFTYKDEQRQLFYIYSNINSFENEDYYKNLGLLDMVETETTSLSLGYWRSSVEIITELVAQFGGDWVDKNDCDDIPYYYISPNPDESILPIHYVTMKEVYEKFGYVVVIKDK